jgi:predicted HTH domain antitoxin
VAQNVLTIEYSDDLLKRLGISREKFPDQAKFLLAAKLYELGHLSSGEAATMAGLGRVDFLLSLNKIGIPMSNLQLTDLESDIDFALNG